MHEVLKKVISLGAKFSVQNIMELIYSVEPSFIWELVQRNSKLKGDSEDNEGTDEVV